MSVQKSLRRAHLSSIAISCIVNAMVIGALLFLIDLSSDEVQTPDTAIELKPPQEQEQVEEPPEPEEPDPLKELENMDITTDFNFEAPAENQMETDSQEVVETVTEVNATEMADLMSDIASPVTMQNIMFGRTKAGRIQAMGQYGGGMGKYSEPAVLKALEWLDRVQVKSGKNKGVWLTDGENGRPNSGMTGLALLTFLAHGETPTSADYGDTVANGIKYLINNQDSEGIFQPAGSHTGYGHAMATYALAEAYTMTGNLLLEEPLERALEVMIKGRNPSGGYDYDYAMKSSKYGFERSDNSLTAWHLQAMKAVRISGVGGERLRLEIQSVMDGMLAVSAKHDYGRGFGYTNSKEFKENPASRSKNKILSAAGALCLDLSGRGRSREANDTMDYVETFLDNENIPEWGKVTSTAHGGEINLWYYAIQAFFHDNPTGMDFKKYMASITKALVANQKSDGKWVDFSPKGKHHGPVYNTTLAALSLMVYYRHLPTTQAENIEAYKPAPEVVEDEDDVGFSI